MQFVWFYVPATEDGIELKLSMASVKRHVAGETRFTLICDDKDRPTWYTGHSIHCPRLNKIRGKRSDQWAFIDTKNKITVASCHPEIDEEFIWIMDDVYLLKPATIDDLRQPRFDPYYKPNTKREWHRLIGETFATLQKNGYPTLQYATHLPHVFEKAKLTEMFKEFNFSNILVLFENLYGNRYRTGEIPYMGFLSRVQNMRTDVKTLDSLAETSTVVNFAEFSWGKLVKGWLIHRLGEIDTGTLV